MPTETSVHAEYAGGMRVNGTNGTHALTTDCPLVPGGQAAGFRSMELLLASLAGCVASTIGLLLVA